MKLYAKKALGVTLLEILLVLAIAGMIIVMSIRYYQSATTSQQANMAMEQIQAVTSAADNLSIGSGSYSAVSQTAISNLLGSTALLSPVTNVAITIGAGTPTGYAVTIPLNVAVCTSVVAKLAAVPKINNPACTGGSLGYTYDSTK